MSPLTLQKKRRYSLAYQYKRRYQWLCENGPCVECGSMKNLEVHHKVPADKVAHWVWCWRQERREAELAKCEVLCEKCHLEKTRKDLGWGKCGAIGYQNGCRCDVCRAGHAARKRDYLARLRAKRATSASG